jgi:hypothetical protein
MDRGYLPRSITDCRFRLSDQFDSDCSVAQLEMLVPQRWSVSSPPLVLAQTATAQQQRRSKESMMIRIQSQVRRSLGGGA